MALVKADVEVLLIVAHTFLEPITLVFSLWLIGIGWANGGSTRGTLPEAVCEAFHDLTCDAGQHTAYAVSYAGIIKSDGGSN